MQGTEIEEIRRRFDEAVAYEIAGDFGRAALCYERIIRDFDGSDFDSIRARLVAHRRLKWCIPMEAVLGRLQERPHPVPLTELLGIASEAQEEELEHLTQELEERLRNLPQCLPIGYRLWIWAEHFEPCVQLAQRILAESFEPISLAEVLRTAFPDWAETHPDFPDHVGLEALAQRLGNTVKRIGREYVIRADAISLKIEQFQEAILEQQSPVDLTSQIAALFPMIDFTPKLRSDFVNFFQSHLDRRFIRISEQLWYLKTLLDFNTDPFHSLFETHLLPQTTWALIQHKLFPHSKSPPRLQTSFLDFVQAQLSKNPHLVQIGEDRWLSRERVHMLCKRAIQTLAGIGQALSTQEVLLAALAITPQPPRSALVTLTKLLEVTLRKHPKVIQVAEGCWWHVDAMGLVLDNAWERLQEESQPKPVEWLLAQSLGIPGEEGLGLRTLARRFADALHADTRFLFDPLNHGWLAVPPGPPQNNVAYQVLWESRCPLSFDEIVDAIRDRFELIVFELNLGADDRFRQLPDGRWALSQWVWINDWAFEYLRTVGIPLQASTIVDKVCQERDLDPRLAVFTPEDDPRFVPAIHGRWICRRLLTDEEIEQMFDLLVSQGEQGETLENLVWQVVGVNADATDAAVRLASDERFVNLDERWFAREAAFYRLSDDDVDRLYERLASERPERLPLSLDVLVRQTLGRDWRLTDAEARLQADERFQEVHPGFWTPHGFKPPPIEREPVISPSVRGSAELYVEFDELRVKALTPRASKGRKPKHEVSRPRQVTVTLGLLDILYGNLRVNRQLRALLPEGAKTVQFTDEEGRAFIGYLDDAGDLLDLRGWLAERRLTYGDKLLIQASSEPDTLHIRPTGERDERVYQEAIQRQDVERLIEEARRTKKSYHDLMIEVMEFVGAPLHREDIYQLVNYNRTASRAYIFALLSLSDCPYEELRYFVSHGHGYWSFDRKRKEAFDMKMRELEAEIKSLKAENARLHERLHKQREHLRTVEEERNAAQEEVMRLSSQLEATQEIAAQLQKRSSQLEQVNQQLQAKLQKQTQRIQALEQQVKAQHDEIATLKKQNEQLWKANQEQNERLQTLTSANKELQAELSRMQEQVNQAEAAQAQLEQEITTLRKENEALQAKMGLLQEQAAKAEALEQAVTTAQAEIAALQAELNRLREEAMTAIEEKIQYQQQVEALRQVNANQAEEIARLNTDLERMQRALHSPLGKIFTLLVRLLGRR
jgi:predicted nuclease with TOPRIM domain